MVHLAGLCSRPTRVDYRELKRVPVSLIVGQETVALKASQFLDSVHSLLNVRTISYPVFLNFKILYTEKWGGKGEEEYHS